ncbi:hypothetical protein Tco_0360204 [Tanacetum coccineum]
MPLGHIIKNGPPMDQEKTTLPMLHARTVIFNAKWGQSMMFSKGKPITLFTKSLEDSEQRHCRLYLQRPTQYLKSNNLVQTQRTQLSEMNLVMLDKGNEE